MDVPAPLTPRGLAAPLPGQLLIRQLHPGSVSPDVSPRTGLLPMMEVTEEEDHRLSWKRRAE